MNIGILDGLFTISLDSVTALFVSAILSLFSLELGNKLGFIKKLSIPPIIVGGLLFSIINSILTATGLVTIVADTSLNNILFILFFTAVGFGTIFNVKMMKTLGKVFIILFLFEGLWTVAETVIAIGGAKVTGIPAPIGFLAGTVSLFGGIPGGVAWGGKLEAIGYTGAVGIGLAAGILGQLSGALVSAPTAKKFFIEKHNLSSTDVDDEVQVEDKKTCMENVKEIMTPREILIQIAIMGVVIIVGTILRKWFMDVTGFYVLTFVGCMIVAIIVTNINQKTKLLELDLEFMNKLSGVVLNLFISMSFLSLNLTDLKDLIGPVALIMLVQVIAIVLFCLFIFRFMGKTYDSAILLAGFMGHGLGNVTTAFASMDTLTDQFGSSKNAYLITPLIGACLIDVFLIPLETTAYNIALRLF